jgi:hypothetical protein
VGYCRVGVGSGEIGVELLLEEGEKVTLSQLRESSGSLGEVPEGGGSSRVVIHGLVREGREGGI